MAHPVAKSLPSIALLLLGAAAAGAQQSGPAAPAATSGLEGRWEIELYLDPRSLVNPPPAEKVSGEIAFGTDSWWGNAERFGRYAVDLRPFFGRFFAPPGSAKPFSAADTSFLTEASGGIKGDSVVIDFIPRIDHLGLTFRGRFYGDSARGRWYRRGTDGYGPFVLRRVSKEPVQVAAIPDPAKQAARAQAVAKGGRRATARKQAAAAKATPAAKTAADAPAKAVQQTVAQAAAKPTAIAPTTPATASTPSVTRPTPTPTPASTRPAAQASTQTVTQTPPPPKTEATLAAATPRPQTQLAQPVAQPLAQPVAQPRAPDAQSDGARPATGAPAAAASAAAASAKPPTQPARAPEGVLVAVTSSALAPAPPRTDPAATGALRVRIFDRASQKWFVTKYALRLPDGNWMLANLRTGGGAEGWGAAVRRAPGRHEVEIGDFVCGDKIWFLKNKITRAVEVKAGETTDVSVDLDVTAEPAKPSLDNRSGARCGAAPGNAR